MIVQSYRELPVGKIVNPEPDEDIIIESEEMGVKAFFVLRVATLDEWKAQCIELHGELWPILPHSFYYEISLD